MFIKTLAIIHFLFLRPHSTATGFSIQDKYNACDCSTRKPQIINSSLKAIEADADENLYYSISCCAKEYVGTDRGDFNITWSFKGEETSYSTLKSDPKCFGQISSTNRIDFKEVGNHTCTIKVQDGTVFTKFVKVRIHQWKKERAIPIAHNVSDAIYTDLGSSIVMNCTYYLEKGSSFPDVYWRKFWINKTDYFERIASTLGYIKISYLNFSVDNMHYYVGQLQVLNVTKEHFGNYSCLAITADSIISQNISVIKGVNPIIKAEETSRKILILTSVVFICFLLVLCIIVRCRYRIGWKWINVKASMKDSSSRNSFNHDIFIIHGPSASFWVYGFLLAKLESEWSYDCFVPERDLLGGEASSEVISEKLNKSKRTIVVVSECLLRSKWCSYVTSQAIHKSLTNSSRVVAITLMDMNQLKNIPEDTQSIINILKFLKKISCPLKFVPKTLSWHICVNDTEENNDVLKDDNDAKPSQFAEATEYTENEEQKESSNLKLLPSPDIIAHISTSQSSSTFLPLSNVSTSNIVNSYPASGDFAHHKHISQFISESNKDSADSNFIASHLRHNMILGSLKIMRLGRRQISDCQNKRDLEKCLDQTNDGNLKNPTKIRDSNIKNIQTNNSEISRDYDKNLTFQNFIDDKEFDKNVKTFKRSLSNKGFQSDKIVNKKDIKDSKVNIMRIFMKNSQEIFWQKLRLHLPPQCRKISRIRNENN